MSRTSTAYHEAGHAVIGYRVGRKFGWRTDCVHIIPNSDVTGDTHSLSPPRSAQLYLRKRSDRKDAS
jgi:ATP-dependent Zn protease